MEERGQASAAWGRAHLTCWAEATFHVCKAPTLASVLLSPSRKPNMRPALGQGALEQLHKECVGKGISHHQCFQVGARGRAF